MNLFFDTSALIKNYVDEPGSGRVTDALQQCDAVLVSGLTLLEGVSTLRRLLAHKLVTTKQYQFLKTELHKDWPYFTQISVDAAMEVGVPLINKHQLKTLDAIQLGCALLAQHDLDTFVCCDDRLLRAAKKESLSTWNPLRRGFK